MKIGKNITELRLASRLSQEQLAENMGVSRQAITKWEADSSIPALDNLIALADFFEVSLDKLVGRKETDYAALKTRIEELSDMCIKEFDCDITPMVRRYMEFMQDHGFSDEVIVSGLSAICGAQPHYSKEDHEVEF